MKKLTVFILFLAGAVSALAANGPANCNIVAGPGKRMCPNQPCAAGQCNQACPGLGAATTPIELGDEARKALLFQIDEERMAGELYAAFGAKWDLRPFRHVQRAETRHETVLKNLANRAGLVVPEAVAGTFASGEVQKRYDSLLNLGLESADSALRVGAFVEEQDIADLRTLAATTDSVDLQQVVKSLENASSRHLSAFVRSLAARGVTYEAQVLGADELARLAQAAPRRCGMGGRGYRCGN
ncbi:MAG: DUF2202 domain-containing protein [Opitutaceae bacterium]|nr:DUF2202 domain-containing protein [Opitutaceae bacterium]